MQQHKKGLQKTAAELARSRKEQEEANRKIELYQEQQKLVREKKKIEAGLVPIQRIREKAFKNYCPLLYKIGAGLSVLCGVLTLVLVIFGWVESWILTIVGVFCSASWFCFNRMYALNDREEERAKKVYAKWEKLNPHYGLLVENLQKLEERLNEINKELVSR